MPNPKQSSTAIPSLTASDIDTAYSRARVVIESAITLNTEELDTDPPLSPRDAMLLRAAWIALAYETTAEMLAKVPKGLFEGVSVLYPLGNPSPTVGNNPYPSALEGLYAEVRRALDIATYPARRDCMDRHDLKSDAEWVRASWPSQSPEDERTRFAGLVAAMQAIATRTLRTDLERERRFLRARLGRVAKPAEVEDDADFQPATAFPQGMRNRLRKAALEKRVRKRRRGHLNIYSRSDARALWPRDFPSPRESA